jgi:hypothetical protein
MINLIKVNNKAVILDPELIVVAKTKKFTKMGMRILKKPRSSHDTFTNDPPFVTHRPHRLRCCFMPGTPTGSLE